jgi:glutamate dehydrogenase (NADP+)
VGAREISYLFGQYKRLSGRFDGALTGKALEYGGSLIRKEATGYGNAYFMEEMLKHRGDSIEGKTCVISGSGNVALYCAEKVLQLGGRIAAFSDSGGYIFDPDGIDAEKLAWIIDLKTRRRGRLGEYHDSFGGEYHAGQRPWYVPCDLAFPCATQNELDSQDARALVDNGCIAVSEGANMPCTHEALQTFRDNGVLFGPGKAANAGGVAISGLEMTQNSMRLAWTAEELESRLQSIMKKIHRQCTHFGEEPDGYMNYVKGANIAGFIKVADAMLAYGVA